MKNIFLFVGVLLGTVLLIAGVVTIGHGDGSGWLYIIAAIFCVGLGLGLARRLQVPGSTKGPDA
jgi:hypothetical protein